MSTRTVRPSTGPILDEPDIVLIGGGIMLKRLNPDFTIQIVESLPCVALESSHA